MTTVTVFSPAQRGRHAIVALVIGAVAAAALIPIPIIHLLGIPLVLVTSIVIAVKQLRVGARVGRVAVNCPKCAAPQAIGGGFGFASIDGPIPITCDSCRRMLTLTVQPGPTTAHEG